MNLVKPKGFQVDDLIVVSFDHGDPLSGVEYVLPPEKLVFIENYFSYAPKIQADQIEITLDGRKIEILGLNEEESLIEFQKAFGDFFHPIVNIVELARVIDHCIINELFRAFNEITPFTQARGLGRAYGSTDANKAEIAQINLEIDRFTSDIPTPGELREAIERLPSARAKRILLQMYSPMITVKEIEIAQTAMKIRNLQKPFMNLIHPFIQPIPLMQALAHLPAEYQERFQLISSLLQKRVDVFKTLESEYSPIHTMLFVLGEELHKRIIKTLPVHWQLPKENVPRLRTLIEYQRKGLEDANSDSQFVVFIACDESDIFESLLKLFQEDKDYVIDDEMLSQLIPITKMPLHPWPRVERVKQAFRNYARIERLLVRVTDEMFLILEKIKKELSNELRDRLGEDLERAKSLLEKLKVIEEFMIPGFHFTHEEQGVLIDLLSIYVPASNEFLMEPIRPFGITDEMIQILERIKLNLNDESRLHLFQALEQAPDKTEQLKLIEPFKVADCHFSPDDEDELIDFLLMFIPLEPQRTVRDDLIGLEANARQTLSNVCSDIGVKVVFKQLGREISVGSLKESERESELILKQMWEEESEDELDQVVLSEFEDNDDWQET